jgi:hypothetical protein
MIDAAYVIIGIVVLATVVFVGFGASVLLSDYKRRMRHSKVSSTQVHAMLTQTTISYQEEIPVVSELQQTTVSVSSGRTITRIDQVGNGQPLPAPPF